MTIAYRTFLDYRARRTTPERLIEPADRHGNPLDAAEQSEMRDHLNAAIANLAEPIREVVVLHYSGGLSLRQTADAMGISTGTVKSRLNTALRALRSVLE
jgi:RNA polymerase sigma factor (sigma-70 family)